MKRLLAVAALAAALTPVAAEARTITIRFNAPLNCTVDIDVWDVNVSSSGVTTSGPTPNVRTDCA